MMASSATERVGDLPTVHSTTSALSAGEIHLEDTLQVRCLVVVLDRSIYTYIFTALMGMPRCRDWLNLAVQAQRLQE